MGHEDHIRIAQSGAQAIDNWRRENPGQRLNLRGANLRRANLTHANLSQVDMREVNLEWADLRWADLIGADLTAANLSRTDLHKVDLTGANLSNSLIHMSNFEDANLSNADLTGATFSCARLLNTDLSAAKGLEKTHHSRPSEIDQETIAKTDDIPIEFLSGCGLSDREVRSAIRSLVSTEVFSDFLEMAAYLLLEGYKDPAAVMIGSVVEQHISELCLARGIVILEPLERGRPTHKRASTLNDELRKAGAYNLIDHRHVQAWFDIRNQAAHGHYDEYTQEQVEIMLKSVVEFIARTPIPGQRNETTPSQQGA